MNIKTLGLTLVTSLMMFGLSACNSEEDTSTTSGPDFSVSMSALGYLDIPDYESLVAKYNETKDVPTTLSYESAEHTSTPYKDVTMEKTWTDHGSFDPTTKKFTFGNNVENFLYDYIDVHLLNFKNKEGKTYQYGYTSAASTAKKPYCIVEYTQDEMSILEFDITGHIAYLKFSPAKETVKEFKLTPVEEYDYSKLTIDSHIEYHIKKYEGYSKNALLLPKQYKGLPITGIKENVFKDLSISKIFFLGSEAEFTSITIEEGNDCLSSATKYFYSEEKPAETGNFFHFVNGEIEVY